MLRLDSARALLIGASGQRGFTLVELLVTVVLVSVVAVAILMIFSSLTGVFYAQGVRVQNQDDARTAINQIARYIRMATSSADNMTSQSDAIAVALPQEIEFYCDVDSDAEPEKVRYYLEGSTLRMQTAEPQWVEGSDPHYEYPAYDTDGILVQDAIQNGTGAIFEYFRYDSGGVVAFTPANDADRTEIVTVTVSLAVNERPDLTKGVVVLETGVQIRQRYEGGLE